MLGNAPPSLSASAPAPGYVDAEQHVLDRSLESEFEFPPPAKTSEYRRMLEFIIGMFPQAKGEELPVRSSRYVFEDVFSEPFGSGFPSPYVVFV